MADSETTHTSKSRYLDGEHAVFVTVSRRHQRRLHSPSGCLILLASDKQPREKGRQERHAFMLADQACYFGQ